MSTAKKSTKLSLKSSMDVTVTGDSKQYRIDYSISGGHQDGHWMTSHTKRDEMQMVQLIQTELPTMVRGYLAMNPDGTHKIGFKMNKNRYIPVRMTFPTQMELYASEIAAVLDGTVGIKTLEIRFENVPD